MSTFKIIQPEQAIPHRPGPPAFARSDDLVSALQAKIKGEVRFDKADRALYATDGSNYRQVPIGVVIPRDIEDVILTMEICRQFGAPVLSRGGGTSLAGQCCNVAVIMDFSKYMNRVLSINAAEKWARVQPGCILDHLRSQANESDLTFGPDPSTHDHCTLGGMLGNNSCGVHSQMAGRTSDNTEELDILTYDGLRMTVGWMTDADLHREAATGGRRGEIFSGIKQMRDKYAALIRERYPNIPRRVSGYNLNELLPGADGRFNLARALVGSEGTLVTILEAKVRLVPWPKVRSLLVLGYPDIYHAADHLPDINSAKPMGLEAIDEMLVKNLRKKHLQEDSLKLLPEGKGWLLVEFGGESKRESDAKAQELMSRLRKQSGAPTMKLYDDPAEEHEVWIARESGLGATAFVPGEPVTWEGWEDSAVAPEKMGEYLRALCDLYKKHGYRGAFYGHFGQGCLHTRINFDLQSEKGIRNFRSFLDDASTLVTRLGGSLSGEHGDGQSKAEFLVKMFGPELIEAFNDFKAIWDPQDRMNPRKLVHPYRVDENLRLGAHYHPWKPETHFRFPDDNGSFSDATLRCVGVGKCRRMESHDETMCPSFMVMREEKHTTRGRAHLLWEMMEGDPLDDGWKDETIKESLDLCLACKGCKGDCPVNVDVATFKAEFLSHYYEGRRRPLNAYAFGFIDKWANLAAIWPGAVNLFTQTPLLRKVMKIAGGLPQQRQIPAFAARTFQKSFISRRNAGRPSTDPQTQQRVLLWPDTFNNHFFPDTAMAAVAVLEAAGFAVDVPQGHLCCGRPLYDFGLLDQAKKYLRNILSKLKPQIDAGTPIVVLEPSCASVFRDELQGLFPNDPDAEALRKQVFLLSEFLEKNAADFSFPALKRKALVHGHCHHKSLMKIKDEVSVLHKLGLDLDQPESGCCGMAGAFGFEKDKYPVSMAVGERVLLPAVRHAAADTLIIADGFSCREQISQCTDRSAVHLAEVLKMSLDQPLQARDEGLEEASPEQPIVESRRKAEKRSRWIAAAALTGIGLAAFMTYRRLAAKRT